MPRKRTPAPAPWPTEAPQPGPVQVDPPLTQTGQPAQEAGPFAVFGTTGLNRASGYVYEEFLHELQGVQGRRVYRQMRDNDAIVAALLHAITMLIRKVEWEVSPADDSPEAEEVAQFCDDCLHDMSDSWDDTLAQILTMLVWGWAYLELVYKQRGGDSEDATQRSKYDDGRIGWRKWAIRSQESLFRWEFDPDGGVQGMWQQPPPDFKLRYIPIEKALLFRTSNDKGNPEGISLLRRIYRSWYFRTKIEQIEGIGIERDLAGLPVIYAPAQLFQQTLSSGDQTTLDALKNIVRNIRRDEQEGVLMPMQYDKDGHKLYELTLLSTGGQRQFDTGKTKEYYANQALMTVLADFIMLGHETTGTYSLSADKSELFSEAVGAWADGIAYVINSHAFPRLLRMNGIDTKLTPELGHKKIERIDVGKLAEAIGKLSAAGMPIFPNPEVERSIYESLDLPVPAEASADWRQNDWGQDEEDPEQPEQQPPDAPPAAQQPADGEQTQPTKPPPPASKPPPNGRAKAQQRATAEPERLYASTQLDVPPPLSDLALAYAATMRDDELAADGREDNPHITVCFGVQDEDLDTVAAIAEKTAPLALRLGQLRLFRSDAYDVVWVEVFSDDHRLEALHDAIALETQAVSTQPFYVPHMTLAYMQPGAGTKYEGVSAFEGLTFTADRLTFSGRDRTVRYLKLGGRASDDAAV